MTGNGQHNGNTEHHGPRWLGHHFVNAGHQYQSDKLGMWLFLVTEVLFFSGLFCAYAVYRRNHPEVFIYASEFLDVNLGAINTVVLLCSSLTMALAVRYAQLSQRIGLVICLGLTILFAFGFLGIKAVEYEHKWKHGLLWGDRYQSQEHHGEDSQATDNGGHGEPGVVQNETETDGHSSDVQLPPAMPEQAENNSGLDIEKSILPSPGKAPEGLVEKKATHGDPHRPPDYEPRNVQLFFGVYFAMTGLHGLHVIIGIIVIGVIMWRSWHGHYSAEYFTPVDLTGLYWHLVDLIWIFLFPLLYLIH
jgi:cytochrome c oxidase subunit 3